MVSQKPPVVSRKRIFEYNQFYLDQMALEHSSKPFFVFSIGSGIGIIPITPDGKFILVREFRLGAYEYQWNWPAGTIEEGEEPMITAHREFLEETSGRYSRSEYLGVFNSVPGYLEGELHFVIFWDVKDYTIPAGDEINSVSAFSYEEVMDLIAHGEIKHTGTIMAFFLALERHPYLREGRTAA